MEQKLLFVLVFVVLLGKGVGGDTVEEVDIVKWCC